MDDGRPSHTIVFLVIFVVFFVVIVLRVVAGGADYGRIGGEGWESADPTTVAHADVETGCDHRPPKIVSGGVLAHAST
jgi:hypothetical protein